MKIPPLVKRQNFSPDQYLSRTLSPIPERQAVWKADDMGRLKKSVKEETNFKDIQQDQTELNGDGNRDSVTEKT